MSRQIKEILLQVLPSHTKLYIMYGLLSSRPADVRRAGAPWKQNRVDWRSNSRGDPEYPGRKGKEVTCGQSGELVARGPNIMQGYWMDETSTSSVLDENGYHTGDIGYRDEEGYFYVIGRKDDLLKVGGHRIYLQEIEDALMETELLVEVAVIGVEDGLLGRRLVAIAVPVNGNINERDILASASPGCPDIKFRVKSDWSTRCPRISMVKLIVQVQGVAHQIVKHAEISRPRVEALEMNQFLKRLLGKLATVAPGGNSLRPWLHRMRGVHIGKDVWIGQYVYIDEIHPEHVVIKENVAIGFRCTIFAHFYKGRCSSDKKAGNVVIEKDVFIGPNCTILQDVTIGEGSVVVAGSVVTKTFLPECCTDPHHRYH